MSDFIFREGAVIEAERELKIMDSADVVVAGGGVAGLGAAIASARAGVKTILIESNGFLGGVATSNMMQALCNGSGIHGIMEELIALMTEKGGAPKWDYEARKASSENGFTNEAVSFDVETFKEAALEMCVKAGVIMYLYTKACLPIMDGDTVIGVVVESKNGRSAIMGKRVIDCTGDGDLAFRAGVPFIVGRPSDNKMRPFALMFRVGGLDINKMLEYMKAHPDQWQPQYMADPVHPIGDDMCVTRVSGFYDLVAKAKKNGDLHDELNYLRFEALFVNKGIALCNTTRMYYLDGTNPKDLTEGEVRGRQQMKKVVAFMRKYVPGCENAYVIDVAPTLGVRETRRFIGEFFLSDEDVYNGTKADDSFITITRKLPPYELKDEIDVHPPEPWEGTEKDVFQYNPKKILTTPVEYHVFYRMLLPQKVENLLFAGRTMSTTHANESYLRLMPYCMRMGQVAGTGAAVSVKEGVSPKKVDFRKLKNELIAQGYTKF